MRKRKIKAKNARALFNEIFKKIGVSSEIYKYVVEGLVETSLRGVESHGIRLIPHYIKAAKLGRINKKPKFSFKKTSPSTILVNADHAFGIVSGNIAMKKAIQLAKRNGVGIAAVKNSSHFGSAAIYSLLAAKSNMIGLSFTNVESFVLPYGGKKPFLGTNPICFAAPCEGEDPFCLDMATTRISWNKLLVHRNLKKQLKEGWAADENGNETLDPEKATALFPTGEYKGYGLALMVEILCSLLTGMSFGPYTKRMYPVDGEKRFLGHIFMAINISKFENINRFKKRLKLLIKELRGVPPSPNFDRVRVAGDPEKENYKIRSKEGIPFSEQELETFINLATELKVNNKYLKAFLK